MINKKSIIILAFFAVSILCGILSLGINSNDIIIFINILIVIMFSNNISKFTSEDREDIIEKIKYMIVFSVLLSGIWGLVNNAFLNDVRGSSVFVRFKGSYEPNFMALYINIGLITLYYLKERFLEKKVLYYSIFTFFIIMLLMTSSITGFIIFAILILIYLIKNRKFKLLGSLVVIGIIGVGVIIAKVNTKSDNKELGRIEMIIYKIENGEWDSLSSGRLPIARNFLNSSFKRPILNILLGNGPDTKMIYSEYFKKDKYSHNTYIDFIYNFGVIGAIIILSYIIMNFRENKLLGMQIEDGKDSEYFRILKIAILITSITLPLSNEMIFLLIFI